MTPFVLSALIFLPALGAALLALIPREHERAIKITAFGVALITTVLAYLVAISSGVSFPFSYVFRASWISFLNIDYFVGVDSNAAWLVFFTALISCFSVYLSFQNRDRLKLHLSCLFILETALIGAFCSLDLILFYSFFELTLIPIFLLIYTWGGSERRLAANKFFIYTFAGSIFMLVGIITLGLLHKQITGEISFAVNSIQHLVETGQLWRQAPAWQGPLFWMFALAFMVKSPIFPFHTWLPTAYKNSPISLLVLSAMVLKLGSFGFLRFCLPIFPDAVQLAAPILMTLAVIGIVYGGVLAAVQKDLVSIIAYSSLSHMGFIFVGIFSLSQTGLTGGIYQQLNHSVATALLFFLIGLLYIRRQTFLLDAFGGLKSNMPILAALFLLALLSSVGLPGTGGFIGEFLSLLGGFQSAFSQLFGLNVWLIVLAATGVVLSAVYMLRLYQGVFYGQSDNPLNSRLKDLQSSEIALASLLGVALLWMGLSPKRWTNGLESDARLINSMVLSPEKQRGWNGKGIVSGNDKIRDTQAKCEESRVE
jgi:NADH-quinone oxidoreductase subunit M